MDVYPGIEFYGSPKGSTLALGAQSKNRNPALLPSVKTIDFKSTTDSSDVHKKQEARYEYT